MTYRPPTSNQTRAILWRLGLSGSQAARAAYLSDGRTVRRYTASHSASPLPGAVLLAWLLHARHPKLAAQLEREMREAGAELDRWAD